MEIKGGGKRDTTQECQPEADTSTELSQIEGPFKQKPDLYMEFSGNISILCVQYKFH